MIDLSRSEFAVIKKIFKEIIPEAEIWFFGSRVTGKAKKYSDLDVLIKTPETLNSKTKFELENRFSLSDLVFKVDLIDFYTIDEEFKTIIFRNSVKLEDMEKALNYT